jgi:diguanylate cyclase (GGDEF)-like protein
LLSTGPESLALGGEEFLVIVPEATLENAARRAQEICDGIRQLRIEYQARTLGPITVSIGVSGLGSPGEASVLALLKTADTALYRAKREGRNRVVIFEDRPDNTVEGKAAAAAKA